jgi:hypothetical protein
MKKMLAILILTSLLLTSCSPKSFSNPSKNTLGLTVNKLEEKKQAELPQGFTLDKIEEALLEYINYRLWLYPSKLIGGITTGKEFDNYVNKSIEVEIRVYETDSGKLVCGKTNIGERLMVFRNKHDFVYCDGQIGEEEQEQGQPGNIEIYAVLETYTVTIPEPHKPNYGTSQRKEKMLAAFESYIKKQLYDLYNNLGGPKLDEWAEIEVFIADFYEYEDGAHAWFLKKDGSIESYAVYFIEANGEFQVQSLKGYTMNSKDEFNEWGRFYFERDMTDAVSHFICNEE